MRRLVLPALLLALAISVGAGDDAAGAAASTAGNGAVQVTLQLAATTVTSGSVLSGRLTIVNGSHKPIRYVTCGSLSSIGWHAPAAARCLPGHYLPGTSGSGPAADYDHRHGRQTPRRANRVIVPR